jgi:tetratricopeptide (TPR) repeat protein
MFARHWSEALTCTEDAMDRLAEDQTLGIDMLGYNPYTMLADLRAGSLNLLGRTAEALQWFEKALQRARDDHDLLMLGVVCADYGANFSIVGDAQVALERARQGAEIGEKVGGATTRMHAYAQLGSAYLRVGSYAEAVTSSERSRAIARESHAAFEIEPLAAAYLAEGYAHTAEPERALRTAEEAVAGARQHAPGMEPFAQLALVRVLLQTQGLAARSAIEEALEELSQTIEQMGLKTLNSLVSLERAELARLAGDEAARQRELRDAHRLFLEIGAPIRAAEVAKELGLPATS